MNHLLVRDERQQAVDRDADRLTAAVLSFGILALVLVRSLRGEAAWDLLALVVAGGMVGTAYRGLRGTIDRRWVAVALATSAVAAVTAAVTVALAHP